MSLGSMTLACLLMAAQTGAADVWHMSQTRFSIPIRINPERRAEIKELLLYASRDQGLSWDLVGRCTPEKEGFPFFAQNDGSYWFSVAIVDQQNQQDPRDPRQGSVGQKIIVDTKKPDARIVGIERVGDEVVVRYEVRDENLDPASLKLEYRSGDSPSPHPTPVALVPGQTTNAVARFRPASGAPLAVRLTVKDQAGNEGVAQQELAPANNTSLLAANTGAGGPGPNPPIPMPPVPQPQPQPIPPAPYETVGLPQPQPQPQPQPIHTQPFQPGPGQTLLAQTNPVPQQPHQQPYHQPQHTGQPVAHTGAGLTQVSSIAGLARDRQDFAPSLEVTNKRDFKVEFEVSKFGPSGIENVDVYLTTDNGRTWTPSTGDHKVVLPPVMGDPNGPPGSLRGHVMIRLPQEGVVYGLILNVRSKAGLSKKPPVSGDAPHMLVELDSKPPEADLYAPLPSGSRPDVLVMRWKAEDKNLAANPITLEWAANRTGPWTPIGGAELPNTGSHNWEVRHDIPPRVFLRLTVRDAAGNTAVAQTQEAITIDLSVPEIKILPRSSSMLNNR